MTWLAFSLIFTLLDLRELVGLASGEEFPAARPEFEVELFCEESEVLRLLEG